MNFRPLPLHRSRPAGWTIEGAATARPKRRAVLRWGPAQMTPKRSELTAQKLTMLRQVTRRYASKFTPGLAKSAWVKGDIRRIQSMSARPNRRPSIESEEATEAAAN
jgi:hypothetical protein